MAQPADIRAAQRRLRNALRVSAAAAGALYAWDARHFITPDGLSYLDLADAAVRGDAGAAVNALWSPLYPWLVGSAASLFEPSAYWLVPLAHLVNFAVYLLALAGFELLLGELIRPRETAGGARSVSDGGRPLPSWAWLSLGYTLFVWTSLRMTTVATLTPDVCIAACVYAASALLLRIRRGAGDWQLFAAAGAVLGVGYLAKNSFLPSAVVFLIIAGSAAGSIRRAAPRVLLASAMFLCVAAVYFVPLSEAQGRLTFGDSARLNYLWYVNGVRLHVHWQGGPPPLGTPEHPTRKIFDAPAAYEFGAPVQATYPPWFDPAYWHAGARPRFDLNAQARVLKRNLKLLGGVFREGVQLVWIIGFLALYVRGCRNLSCLRRLGGRWELLLPALAALAGYSLVHVEVRYLGAFVTLLALGLFSAVRLPGGRRSKRWTASVVLAVAAAAAVSLAPTCVTAVGSLARVASKGVDGTDSGHWQVAEALRRAGLGPGDKVASIGYGFEALWAHLAGLRVVAEISSGSLEQPTGDAESFWASEAARRREVLNLFAENGAKAVVANRVPAGAPTDGWERVGDTDYYIYSLSR